MIEEKRYTLAELIESLGDDTHPAAVAYSNLIDIAKKHDQLWMLLDDIDTGGDMFKPDSAPYVKYVERKHRERFSISSSPLLMDNTNSEGIMAFNGAPPETAPDTMFVPLPTSGTVNE